MSTMSNEKSSQGSQGSSTIQSKDVPVETYTIISTLMTLVVSHACGEISDRIFSKRVEEESINLLCVVE